MPCPQLVDILSDARNISFISGSMPALEHLGILLVPAGVGDEQGELPPGSDMMLGCGIPMAHEQGAEGVCTAIGELVRLGFFPALKEVGCPFPGVGLFCAAWYACFLHNVETGCCPAKRGNPANSRP